MNAHQEIQQSLETIQMEIVKFVEGTREFDGNKFIKLDDRIISLRQELHLVYEKIQEIL